MNLEEITLEILAQRALTHFDSKKLVDWAVKVLELGYESDNIFILAGLDFEETKDREKYFWKSIEDLKLDFPKNENELIESYAFIIANKAVRNEVTIEFAFDEMLKVVLASDYDSRYMPFFEIEEDLDYLRFDNLTIFNSDISLENKDKFIREEFEIFVEMEKLKIPKDQRNKCYCQNCQRLIKPVIKTKFQFKRPFKYGAWSCESCKSENIIFSSDHKVKRKVIDEYKNSHNHR